MTRKKKTNSLGVTISNHINFIVQDRDLATKELLDSLGGLSDYCLSSSFTVSQEKRNTKETLLEQFKNLVLSTIKITLASMAEIELSENFNLSDNKPINSINYSNDIEGLIIAYNYFIINSNWSIEKWNTRTNNHDFLLVIKNIEKVSDNLEKFLENDDIKINILLEDLNLLHILIIDIYDYICSYNTNHNKKLSNKVINICEYCFRVCNTGKICHIHKTYNSEKMEEYTTGRNSFLESSEDLKNFHNDYKIFRELTHDNNISLMSSFAIDDGFGPEVKKIKTDEILHRIVIVIRSRVWNQELKNVLSSNFSNIFPNIYHLIEPNFSYSNSFDQFVELSYQDKNLNNIYDRSKHPFWFLNALTIADCLEVERKNIEQKKIEIAARDARYFEKKKTMTYKQIVDSEIEEGHMILKEGETRKGKESNIKKIIKRMNKELAQSLKA